MDKQTPLVGIGMLVLGVAIGWTVKPSAASPQLAETPAANPPVASAPAPSPTPAPAVEAPPPGKRAIREPSVKKEPAGPSEKQLKQAARMQGEMAKMMTSRQRSKFEKYIQRISENVDLTEAQKASLTTWLDERMKKLEEMDFTDPGSMEGMTDLVGGLSDKAIDDQLASTFTAEQKEAFGVFKEKEIQTKVDSAALKSLSQLQGVVTFEEGQRDEVYKILSAEAEKRILQEQEKPDAAAMFTEGMGIEMDPYGLGLQQAMTDAMTARATSGDKTPPDLKSTTQSMREIIDKRINDKVEQLRPVLNEKQLEQYRSELKTKGLGVFGTALMGMEGGDPKTQQLDIEIPVQ
ncbi:MAG: hypothetical protein MUF13_03250 [Akkermansiaceae bacterium]|jgi:hypothetical protein|nr:hypothetical protein [Akkermansiaceae bacterium]